MMILYLSCILLGCLPFGHSYPSGAPTSACKDMYPEGHNRTDSQLSLSPYNIVVRQNNYIPGTNVTVEIMALNSTIFKGFFLQARRADCEDNSAVGEFFTNNPFIKTMPCVDGKNDSVTHTSVYGKRSATMTWINRDPNGGDVFFQATIVQDFKTFWAGMKSDIIRDARTPRIDHGECIVRTKWDMFPTAAAFQTKFNVVVIFVMLLINKCM